MKLCHSETTNVVQQQAVHYSIRQIIEALRNVNYQIHSFPLWSNYLSAQNRPSWC